MPDGNSEAPGPDSRRASHRSLLQVSSIEDQSAVGGRPLANDRPSIFSWRDDSCWSVSENTKSRDFRKKRFKKQKGEYLAAKDPPPEILKEIQIEEEEALKDKPDGTLNSSNQDDLVNKRRS
ncbi:hypothetical protein FGIG_03830 [Fasciola gigantica]|uniref:Uncharacterized protein n=2 Tax=Fasciola TaxID=6191 RepID=A0A2H1CTN6_FASHE|nr:hypothetical protein D915_001032 [Fasciola hepatica]TPP64415.1 hypothetical protein FGIG_03830 [Fasciola gigantica]